MVAAAEMRTVVENNAPLSMPVAERMLGLIARIYAMVKNVVNPAIISVFTLVSLGLRPNSRVSMIYESIISIENIICKGKKNCLHCQPSSQIGTLFLRWSLRGCGRAGCEIRGFGK